jgi:hypothetical protein
MESLICKPTDGIYDSKDEECKKCKENPKSVCIVFKTLLAQDLEIVKKHIKKRKDDED